MHNNSFVYRRKVKQRKRKKELKFEIFGLQNCLQNWRLTAKLHPKAHRGRARQPELRQSGTVRGRE